MQVWLAPAKVNLFLHVLRRRNDGYHELQTIFQLLDWYDKLSFELLPDRTISRASDITDVPQVSDLTIRGAQALQERGGVKKGVRIHLEKNVPVGAGLGGGSSDAGTTLLALNTLWGLHLEVDELARIGATLGADVPVFVRRHSAWGEGVGERLTAMPLAGQHFVVASPKITVSTKRVFEVFRVKSKRQPISIPDYSYEVTENDLETTACSLYPETARILRHLRQHGPARMSGSGGSAFLPVASAGRGEEIINLLPSDLNARVCVGIDINPLTD